MMMVMLPYRSRRWRRRGRPLVVIQVVAQARSLAHTRITRLIFTLARIVVIRINSGRLAIYNRRRRRRRRRRITVQIYRVGIVRLRPPRLLQLLVQLVHQVAQKLLCIVLMVTAEHRVHIPYPIQDAYTHTHTQR